MWFGFRIRLMVFIILEISTDADRHRMANPDSGNEYTLGSVREALIRQEDTIIFSLIERAKFPINSPTYDGNYTSSISGFDGSMVEFIAKNTESVQAKVTITLFFLPFLLFFYLWPGNSCNYCDAMSITDKLTNITINFSARVLVFVFLVWSFGCFNYLFISTFLAKVGAYIHFLFAIKRCEPVEIGKPRHMFE